MERKAADWKSFQAIYSRAAKALLNDSEIKLQQLLCCLLFLSFNLKDGLLESLHSGKKDAPLPIVRCILGHMNFWLGSNVTTTSSVVKRMCPDFSINFKEQPAKFCWPTRRFLSSPPGWTKPQIFKLEKFFLVGLLFGVEEAVVAVLQKTSKPPRLATSFEDFVIEWTSHSSAKKRRGPG